MPSEVYVLEFEAAALERFFLVAEVLDQRHGDPVEYGLLGLLDRPFRVVTTVLLPSQHVGRTDILQHGAGVLRLRDEIAEHSRLAGRRLMPLVFIHRHPSTSTAASPTDFEFLEQVFVRQIATAYTIAERGTSARRCPRCSRFDDRRHREYAICFSLIVSSVDRSHSLYALRLDECWRCGAQTVRYVPAVMRPDPAALIKYPHRARLREELEREIDDKVVVDLGWSDCHEQPV